MVVILGGGLTGLVAAHELSRNGVKVAVIEKSDCLGGVLGSIEVKGYCIEKFYHHVFKSDEEFFGLLDELGMADRLVWKNTKTGFYSQGKFHNLSGALHLLNFSLLSPSDRMKIVSLALKVKTISKGELEKLDSVSAKDWIISYLGAGIYRNFFMPLLSSKYGKDLDKASAAWFLERMKIRAGRGLTGEKLGYMEGGFAKVLENLASGIRANGGKIITESSVKKIAVKDGKISGVVHSKGKLKTNCVISTIPPSQLRRVSGIRGEYGKRLESLEYQGCISVLLGISGRLTDFYWTNLIDGNERFGAIVEHTNFIPASSYEGDHILYIASYPPKDSPLWKKSGREIMHAYLEKLRQLLPGRDINVMWWHVSSSRDAGLVYKKGILSSMVGTETPVSGLFAGGMFNSYPERSINESVRIGKECARLAQDFVKNA
jgi:protoporphyrinogen oxidase